MNKKNIQIILILICFAGAGYVLYSGFHSSSPSTGSLASSAASSASGTQSEILLPFGSNFEVPAVLEKNNFQFGAYNYPTVSSTEVGIDLNDLIKPEQKSVPGQK